jgi:molybdate transport system substrate-binding protein
MKDKTVFAIGRPVGAVVAAGNAEFGMQQIIENQPVVGAHLVGPLPVELGNFVPYTAGFPTGGGDSAAGRSLVQFLMSGEVARIVRAKGMELA